MKETKLINPELSRLVSDYERELKKENVPELFLTENIGYTKECLSYCEMQNVNDILQINQELIDKYILYLEQERINIRRGGPLCTGTINKQKNAIRKFWQFLELEGYKVNAINLKQKKYAKKQPTVLSHEEIKWLYSITDTSAIGYRDRCMISLYYGAGLRRSEGLKLVLTDFDFGKGRILIRTPKNKRDRYVMMSPKVQKFIEEYVYQARDLYLAEGSKYERLLIGERGKPIHSETLRSRIVALWKRVKERYNTEKECSGLHTLRHSFGTHLYMAGMDIEKIALLLGHRTLETTQLYIHSANELKQNKKSHE